MNTPPEETTTRRWIALLALVVVCLAAVSVHGCTEPAWEVGAFAGGALVWAVIAFTEFRELDAPRRPSRPWLSALLSRVGGKA